MVVIQTQRQGLLRAVRGCKQTSCLSHCRTWEGLNFQGTTAPSVNVQRLRKCPWRCKSVDVADPADGVAAARPRTHRRRHRQDNSILPPNRISRPTTVAAAIPVVGGVPVSSRRRKETRDDPVRRKFVGKVARPIVRLSIQQQPRICTDAE